MLMGNGMKERFVKGSPHEKKIYTLFDTNSIPKDIEYICEWYFSNRLTKRDIYHNFKYYL